MSAYRLIEAQRLVIEVEGRCAPYEFDWIKLRKTPEAVDGPSAWVKAWKKANHVGTIENVVLATTYSMTETELIDF